jgi:hypothetical protein
MAALGAGPALIAGAHVAAINHDDRVTGATYTRITRHAPQLTVAALGQCHGRPSGYGRFVIAESTETLGVAEPSTSGMPHAPCAMPHALGRSTATPHRWAHDAGSTTSAMRQQYQAATERQGR